MSYANRRGLGAGDVPDIGSERKPVISPYGLPIYRKNGFWWTHGWSITGSGERIWTRQTDPTTQDIYDKGWKPYPRGLKQDQARFNKNIIDPKDDKALARWRRNPGIGDVKGIDTPSGKRMSPISPRMRKKL